MRVLVLHSDVAPDAPPEEQDTLHQIIFDELVKGRVEAASRERFITIMRRMHTAGAQAVILGCTEFGMLLRAKAAQPAA